MLKRFVACIIASIALISCNSNYEFAYLYEDLPFVMEHVQRPQIPVREVDLRDFGGVGDGVTLNSEAFAKAIDVLAKAGDTPNLLLQKTPADEFTVTAKLRFIPNPQLKEKGENCGFVLMGLDYATVRLVDTNEGVVLQYIECKDALKGTTEHIKHSIPMKSASLPVPYSNKYISATVPPVAPLSYKAAVAYIKMEVKPRERHGNVPDLTARFFYSLDGKKWSELTEKPFIGRPGKWIGAKFGLYCNRFSSKNDSGWAQIDWVNVTK